MTVLAFQIERGAIERRTVTATRITVGRAASADLQIDRTTVAERHFELVKVNDGWRVEDCGGTTGTVVETAGRRELVLRRSMPLDLDSFVIIGHHSQPLLRLWFELAEARAACDAPAAAPESILSPPEFTHAVDNAAGFLPLSRIDLEAEIGELRRDLADARRELDRAATARAELSAALSSIELELRLAREASAREQREHPAQLESLRRRLDDAMQTSEALTQQLRKAREEQSGLRRKLATEQLDIDKIARLAQERADVIESLHVQLDTLRHQVHELSTHSDRLTRDNESLRQERRGSPVPRPPESNS